ncbi:hypothetical protein MRX96_058186 [Rhipicephalus microplus]
MSRRGQSIDEERRRWRGYTIAGCLFEQREPLQERLVPDATKEEPYKRSWFCRVGGIGTGYTTKEASLGSNDKRTFYLMLFFGKGQKGRSQECDIRRMPDAMVTKAEREEGTIEWSCVSVDVS